MRFRIFHLLLAATLAMLAPALRAGTVTEIPFQYRDGLLWLEVAVAGQNQPLHFLLDSGAEASVLDAGAARGLGLKLGRPQPVQGVLSQATAYRVDRFDARVGGISLPKSLLALDLRAVGASCHQSIDGLVGADFFRGRIVQIDFSAGRIRLLDEARPGAHATVLPLEIRKGIFCAPVTVAGNPAQRMRIDTGCDSALEWAVERSGSRARGTSIALARPLDRAMRADVQLGSRSVGGVKIGMHDRQIFPGEAGLLGNGLLSTFRVTVDARARRLILE